MNRTKGVYCDVLEELDREEVQVLVVEMLEVEARKIEPVINKIEVREARTMFDNEIVDNINTYNSKKYNFILNYTSLT